MPKLSEKTKPLRQSGIRSASVRCAEVNGINLGQGVCDLPVPDPIKDGAHMAVDQNKSMYSACEGIKKLRLELADKCRQFNRLDIDPEEQLLITHGSTGAFVCAVNALFNPGDEVILFEPFYGYHKNILELNNLKINPVEIDLESLQFSLDDLENAVTPNTKGIVVCTPNNPTGKVYSHEELMVIGKLAEKHDLWIITDEIYEYITYPGHEHISLASLENFQQRCLTISGFSKTYNMTGWRLGYVSGPREVIEKMALLQDLLYVCPVTPLQYAVIDALLMEQSYYQQMRDAYLIKRDLMVDTLNTIGFRVANPQGAYYLLADISNFDFPDSEVAVQKILDNTKVATVPGRAFYNNPDHGNNSIRFCYALSFDKVNQALGDLQKYLS